MMLQEVMVDILKYLIDLELEEHLGHLEHLECLVHLEEYKLLLMEGLEEHMLFVEVLLVYFQEQMKLVEQGC